MHTRVRACAHAHTCACVCAHTHVCVRVRMRGAVNLRARRYGGDPVKVYCEQQVDGGGWMLANTQDAPNGLVRRGFAASL